MNNTVPPLVPELFSEALSGHEYFDSDAHYQRLALGVLAELERNADVVILLTGSPPPDADLFARHLERECGPDRHVGVVREGMLTGVGDPSGAADERTVLVFDRAADIADDVLQRLCGGSGAEAQRRSPIVFLGPDSLGLRLQAVYAKSRKSGAPVWMQLRRLARHEVDSFIRFQMGAARQDQRIFKAPLVALIETYADGDPEVVNKLAEGILAATHELAPESFADVIADLTNCVSANDPLAAIDKGRTSRQKPSSREPEAQTPTEIVASPSVADSMPVLLDEAFRAEIAPETTDEQAPAAPQIVAEVAPTAAEESLPVASPEASASESLSAEPNHEVAAASDDHLSAVAEAPSTESHARALAPQIIDVAVAAAAQDVASEAPIIEAVAPREDEPAAIAIVQPQPQSETPPAEPSLLLVDGEDDLPAAAQAQSIMAAAASEPEQQAVVSETQSAPESATIEPLPAQSVSDPVEETAVAPERAQAQPAEAVSASLPLAVIVDLPQRPVRDVALPGQASRANATGRKWMIRGGGGAVAAAAIVLGVAEFRSHEMAHVLTAWFSSVGDRTAGVVASPPAPAETPPQVARANTDRQPDVVPIDHPIVAAVVPPVEASAPRETSGDSGQKPAATVHRDAAEKADATIVPVRPMLTESSAPPAQQVAALPPAQEAVIRIAPVAPTTSPAAEEAALPAKSEPDATPAPPVAKAVVPSPAAELFLQRGDQLLSQGDIIPARQFFERAAEGGDARAVYRMAKSYDPVYLRRIGVRGVAGDPAKAKAWYEKAIIAGSSEAEMALLQLRASFP